MAEIEHAIRRVDGEPMFGEYGWEGVADPEDWGPAEAESFSSYESEDETEPVEYEMVELTIRRIKTKWFKNGKPLKEAK